MSKKPKLLATLLGGEKRRHHVAAFVTQEGEWNQHEPNIGLCPHVHRHADSSCLHHRRDHSLRLVRSHKGAATRSRSSGDDDEIEERDRQRSIPGLRTPGSHKKH